ncbi:MAG: hypothetical protein WCS15_06355 [Prevotella sp.]
MGDRISIQFKDKYGRESPVIFSHWGGMGFLEDAKDFIKEMSDAKGFSSVEAGKLAVDTIAVLRQDNHEMYLGMTVFDGDNSDNGNYMYNLEKNEWKRHNPSKPKKDVVKDLKSTLNDIKNIIEKYEGLE